MAWWKKSPAVAATRILSIYFDVCQRLKGGQVRQAALENLITAGALDRFHQSRAALLTTLPSAINAATENSGSLFGASSKALAQQKPWSKVRH